MPILDYIYFQHSNELYHYGMPRRSGRYPWGSGRYPWGSGERPYQGVKSSAVSVYKLANEKEKVITKDIKEAAKLSNCKLYGLENRLKTIDSIQRKINKKQVEDGKSEKESMDSIHDSVRYTTISDNKDFVKNYKEFKNNMSDRGYAEIECKNYFDLFNKGVVKHKAVQSQFSTKDGFIFEVQFQTPESQDAKTKKIPIYEERRKVGIDSKRAKELENEMEKLALAVPDPPGIEEIKSHSRSSIKHSSESEVKFKMNEFYYLSHGGPGSGRYPLGSGERPYQKLEGSGRRFSLSGYIQSRKAKKEEDSIKKAIDRKLEDERRKRQMAQDKEKVLRSGTASDVLKYQGQLTNQELSSVISRLNMEYQLRGMSQNEMTSKMDKIDSVMKNVKTGTDWLKTSIDAYNQFAAIYNATEKGKQSPLTFVRRDGGGGGKSNK